MKITKMRFKGETPSTDQILNVERDLKARFERAGFITNVLAITRTSIKIGLHMRTFSLDTAIHDRNIQRSPGGDRLTNLPNWDQRVEFNDIVNAVLNKFKMSGNVKSGAYTIRKGNEVFTEDDWSDQTPMWVRQNQSKGWYIEEIDEKQYLEERRISRNKSAAIKRKSAPSAKQSPYLSLVSGGAQ